MRVIPVDANRLKVLVVGEPSPQMRDGQAAVVIPEGMVAVTWEKNGRSGVMVRATSIKVEGGQAGLRGSAA
jgi:hypothetical protein